MKPFKTNDFLKPLGVLLLGHVLETSLPNQSMTQASQPTKLEQLEQPIKGSMDGDLLHITHLNASSMADKKDELNWCLIASSLYFFSSSLISWNSFLTSLPYIPSWLYLLVFWFFEMEGPGSFRETTCCDSTAKTFLEPTLQNTEPKWKRQSKCRSFIREQLYLELETENDIKNKES